MPKKEAKMRSTQRTTEGWREGGGDANVFNQQTAPSGDYGDWTNDELSAELESRGLAKSGTKKELVARLKKADKQ